MKAFAVLLTLVFGLLAGTSQAIAQSIVYLGCIVNSGMSGPCPSGGSNYLKGHGSWGTTLPSLVVVGGYGMPGDGGGGDFVNATANALPAPCPNPSMMPTGFPSAGNTSLLVNSTTNLAPGYAISATGYLVPGTEISSVDSTHLTITITQAAIQTNTSGITLTVSGDNGGTQIQDSDQGVHRCWYKTNYRGEPHEWGAVGDGKADDTQALEDWLGAYGSAVSKNATTSPTNFGPWIASLPSNYSVTAPLTCPANAVIVGFANDTAGEPGSNPAVNIIASKANFTGGTALMTMQAYCRISGMGFDANNVVVGGVGLDTVDIAGTHAIIDGHSSFKNAGASSQTSGGYGVNCLSGNGLQLEGLQIKDSQIAKANGIGLALNNCYNVRVADDIVQSNGGEGLYFTGGDLSLTGGIIEQNTSAAVHLSGAKNVNITGVVLTQSAQGAPAGSPAAPGLLIDSSRMVSVTGNRIQGNGGDAVQTSEVLFSGASDNITFSGNTYDTRGPTDPAPDANAYPWYVFDVSPTSPPTLTNTHIYDTPAQPGVSVFSPAAQAMLQPLQVPQFTNNQLSGLLLSNGGTTQQINVAPGSAADSTNITLITLASSCVVDLTKKGPGGLDTGNVAANTTYFIYVIAPAGAGQTATAPMPSCMASASLTPTFQGSLSGNPFASSGYLVSATGGTVSGTGGTTVFNVSPSAGAAIGDLVTSADLSSGTTITGFSANQPPSGSVTGTWTTSPTMTIPVNSNAGIQLGMAIRDTGQANCISSGTYVTGLLAGPKITISSNTTCNEAAGATLSISGARQLVLSQPAVNTNAQSNLTISTGYYRLIGALYTGSGTTPPVISFAQDGDTFYLKTPSHDVHQVVNPGLNPVSTTLASVPTGIPVEALGRCVATSTASDGAYVMIFAPPTTPGTPGNFSAAPGFTFQTTVPTTSPEATTAYPFKLYTNSSATISVQVSATSTLDCMTDGWVFHRAQ